MGMREKSLARRRGRGEDAPVTERATRPGPVVLDDTARAIIAELQQDGRRAYAAIGKSVGLSEAAVRARVQRLTDAGVVQIVAVTDPLQLGLARQAMIGLRVTHDAQAVASALSALPEVTYVVLTAGSFDLLVEVVCRSDEHLLHLVDTGIRDVPGVAGLEIFTYLKLAKQTYTWGVS
jgi:Lrp/AsnC family transcriptional regulator for asnA, asnC and gidA